MTPRRFVDVAANVAIRIFNVQNPMKVARAFASDNLAAYHDGNYLVLQKSAENADDSHGRSDMLVEFKVKNFRSFRDEQSLNMTAAKLSELPENTFAASVEDIQLLRSAVIYGPNASGKSNLVKAVSTMRTLVVESSKLPGDRLFASDASLLGMVDAFRLNKDSQKDPTEFEVTFLVDGIRYQYGFVVNKDRVRSETLFAYPNKVPQRLFSRIGEEDGSETWSWSEHLKGKSGILPSLGATHYSYLWCR